MNAPRLPPFSRDVLGFDPAAEADRIAAFLRHVVERQFRRRGLVVGLSGGIDSSVVAALAVRALGPERVLGLLMPERESSAETLPLSERLAAHLGIGTVTEEISGLLEAAGCYRRRNEAIQRRVPGYTAECRSKIVLPPLTERDTFRLFHVIVEHPNGEVSDTLLDLSAYLGIVAATNFKQRCRTMLEYYHADRLNFAVAGTPNRLEYALGFFVKLGDGAADVKPIAHLYKTQVYALGRALGLPAEIVERAPTTDTYSLPQSQEEFYFSVPYDQMDLILFGLEHGYGAEDVAAALGTSAPQVARVYRDILAKRRVAAYLHAAPVLLEGGSAHLEEPSCVALPGF